MKLIRCDRCGRLIDKDDEFSFEIVGYVPLLIDNGGRSADVNGMDFDLCTDCAKHIAKEVFKGQEKS
jgi:hypothetical protein